MKHFLQSSLLHGVLTVVALFAAIAAHAEGNDTIFYETFDTQEAFDRWTVINVDTTSTTTWAYYKGVARILKDMSTPRKAQDDWLLSPAITLDASKTYQLSCYVKSGVNNKKENLRVTIGTATTPESQTQELMDIQNLTKADSRTFRVNFNVAASGTLHLGFHAYSAADQGRIELDSVAVVEMAAASSPAPVTDLTVQAGQEGKLEATLSFTTPTLTSNGDSLASLKSVDVYRSDSLIGSISTPELGSPTTYTDSTARQGYNTYKVVAVGDGGESEPTTVTVYVGEDLPSAVDSLTARRNADGDIVLRWQEPATSQNGGYLNRSQLSYTILLDGDTIAATLNKTYTYTVGQKAQQVYQFTVVPSVDFGTGKDTVANRIIAGTPLLPPYAESFDSAQTISGPWIQDDLLADFVWDVIHGASSTMGKDYDGTDGMLRGKAYYAFDGEQSRVMSPLFDLSKTQNPVLSFYLYRMKSDDVDLFGSINDSITVQVSVDGVNWSNVSEGRFSVFGDQSGWVRCEVPLSEYNGQTVELALLASLAKTEASHRYIYIDSVAIAEAGFSHDLAVRNFSASSKRVSIGDDTKFTVEVLNRSASSVADYQVVLRRDGVAVDSVDGSEVLPTEAISYEFTVKSTLDDTKKESYQWTAEVEYQADEVEANNQTEAIVWSVRQNDVPAPANLTAQLSGSSVSLAWDACTSEQAVQVDSVITTTDDFESYTPFIIDSIGGWTTIDADGGATLASAVIPNDYAHKGEPMAWMVFNTTLSGVVTEDHYDNVFESHSGVQYLMCTSNDDYYTPNDDWLISPELDGSEQTIKFYARTPNSASGADWLRVYYSTTDKHPDSFIQLGDDDHLPVWDYWNKEAYTYQLPAGAKYFAIRCVRCYLYCMVDDVTYNAANGSKKGRTLIGYNVYRDGQKLNAEPIATPDYTDSEAEMESEHVYTVTAVYAEGESGYSNEAAILVTGIGQLNAKTSEGRTAYYTIDGKKATEAHRGVAIIRMADGTVRKVVVGR